MNRFLLLAIFQKHIPIFRSLIIPGFYRLQSMNCKTNLMKKFQRLQRQRQSIRGICWNTVALERLQFLPELQSTCQIRTFGGSLLR